MEEFLLYKNSTSLNGHNLSYSIIYKKKFSKLIIKFLILHKDPWSIDESLKWLL